MEGGREKLCCRARNANAVRWGRKLRTAVAGERSRRSRSPIRHASSSPRRAWPMTAVEGTWSWPSPCVAPAEQPGRKAVPQSLKHSVGFRCDKLGRPGSCLLSSRNIVGPRSVAWRIYASADKAVYRRNQAVPKAESQRSETIDLGGGWTSRPMSTRSRRERRKSCRPLRVTTTDLDVSYAAALSSA